MFSISAQHMFFKNLTKDNKNMIRKWQNQWSHQSEIATHNILTHTNILSTFLANDFCFSDHIRTIMIIINLIIITEITIITKSCIYFIFINLITENGSSLLFHLILCLLDYQRDWTFFLFIGHLYPLSCE